MIELQERLAQTWYRTWLVWPYKFPHFWLGQSYADLAWLDLVFDPFNPDPTSDNVSDPERP